MKDYDAVPLLDDDESLKGIGFSVRILNALSRADVETVGQLRKLTDAELMRLPNLSKVSIKQIRDRIGPAGEPRVSVYDEAPLERMVRRIVREEIRAIMNGLIQKT